MKRHLALSTAGLGVLVAIAPAAAAAAKEKETLPGLVRLSNERSITRVATPESLVRVRVEPNPTSKAGPRLRATTEHGAPEVYLALQEADGTDGRRWVKVRIPRRPNGQTGWVRRDALGRYRVRTTALVVSRRQLHITLYRSGKRVMRFPIGVGANKTPTPGGRFWIREKLTYRMSSLYGDRALGTSAYAPTLENWPLGGVVGIHGTGLPKLIPGRPSHGCIRVKNRDIRRLFRAAWVGTPLHIR